ncbi:MAG: DUF5615 family PIN-like protein [Patescibacteria group bacterium]
MKFLTDENIGFKVTNPLRKNGFDIKSILETNPGADDVNVLSIAAFRFTQKVFLLGHKEQL